jgi:hypothetical protein
MRSGRLPEGNSISSATGFATSSGFNGEEVSRLKSFWDLACRIIAGNAGVSNGFTPCF